MNEPDGINGPSLEEDELDELLSSFQTNKDPTPILPSGHKTITLEGVKIEFPYRAYESQLQMMRRIIIGVKNRQNCLLESPTGTGKTAAILCSLLAWQKKCKEYGHANWDADDPSKEQSCTCGFDIYPDATILQDKKDGVWILHRLPEEREVMAKVFDDSDVPSPSKKKKVDIIPEEKRVLENLCGACLKKHFYESVPRIYYATRTHSQIAQVVKQLKVTEYSGVSMTILSSRQQVCINEEVLKEPPRSGLNQRCQILREGFAKNANEKKDEDKHKYPACKYFAGKGAFPFRESFPDSEELKVWDIEDIVRHGNIIEKCPYYGCRELHGNADIVFLAYNYLLDPEIRSRAQIKFPNSVLVFDEAHNIEQICCDMMSVDIPLEFLNNIRVHFDYLSKKTGTSETTVSLALKSFCIRLKRLSDYVTIEAHKLQTALSFDGTFQGSKIFSEANLVDVLISLGLGPDDLEELKTDFNNLTEKNDAESNDKDASAKKSAKSPVFIPTEHGNFLIQLIRVLKKIYYDDMRRLCDYRGILEKKCTQVQGRIPAKVECSFSIVCLNAGIAFEKLKESARTIIVTSGTLSPTISFASELETDFHQVLSAKHVIDSSQIWAGVMTTGLTHNLNLELNASNLKKEDFLDELGEIILEICQKVPNGVLIFFSSYKTLDNLRNRWSQFVQGESTMNRLEACKKIFYEQSGQENINIFKETMRRYQEEVLVGNGAVLFAVFRGKVSEGVDFKDEQARAVVTIGIPYPYFGDRVTTKMDYNNKRAYHSPRSGYLTGRDWYSALAFRAMNQAFGRCLRHRHDWGALILIDSRIPTHKSKLSAWVVNFLRSECSGGDILRSLDEFMQSKEKVNDTTQVVWNSQLSTQPIDEDEDMDMTQYDPETQGILD